MRVLVTGAGGMVGRAVRNHCESAGDDVAAYDHEALDIADDGRVLDELERLAPDVVINCAAWTDVDGCEKKPRRAKRANALGPEVLASACRRTNAAFVTISTDYVFDGEKEGFYTQRDDPNPLSVYAKSKLDGERRAHLAYARTIVVRTGFIFGAGGRNYLSQFVELARKGQPLSAISDSWGTPTYAPDLAVQLRRLSELDLPGIYHVVNEGDGASYEEIVRQGLEFAGLNAVPVQAISMDSLQRPAPRPRNSRLRCLLTPALGLESLRPWQDALREFVAGKGQTDVVARA